MEKHDNISEASDLRRKAEASLINKALDDDSQLSDVEYRKLIYELRVHQIELELQNEELCHARELAEVASDKYIRLYDLAPAGYFTLTYTGEIIELNLAGALLLGKVRSHLINKNFHFFLSGASKDVFKLFLENSFKKNTQESCEVCLTNSGKESLFLNLSGITSENRKQCMVTAVDITKLKQSESEIKRKSAILNNLIIHVQEGILLEDSNRKIVLTNQLFCDMFSIPAPPEALAGADCSESAEQTKHFFRYPDKFVSGINMVLANQKAVYNDELELLDGRHFERDYIPTWLNEVYSGHLWKYRDITERKLSQQKLQASEERYHSIFEGSPDGILIADADTKMITYANSAICRALGYTMEQLKAVSIAAIHPQDSFQQILAEFESMLHGDKILAENIQCLKKNGEIFFADISSALILINGRPQLLGFFRDITVRKKVEDELKKRSQAIEQSPVIIYITNREGIIEYANPKATEVSGYASNEIVGQNPRIFSSGEKPKEEYKSLWQTISTGKEWKGEFHNKRKNGGLYWVAASISPVINNIGMVTHYLAIEEDITERKMAEQHIHELNANLELTVNKRTTQYKEALGRLEKIADRVPGVVYQYLLNPDGSSCFPFASEGIRDIYQVSPEEVVHDASAVYTRIHPDDFDSVVASIQTSAKDNSLWQHEYRVRFDDGTMRWLSGSAKPQTEPDGTVLWHGYISDITERKQVETAIIKAKEEADKANQAKSEFLSRMSHELRTPMNSILGFAQLLEMGELKASHKTGVNHILNSGKHLLNLINEVLDIAGIEAGRVSLSFIPVEVGRIITETIDTLYPSANKMRVTLELINQESDSLFVNADHHRLRQVLINLISNAIKYNREGGSVMIKTELQPGIAQGISFVRISVSDTGPGINPELIEKLFMPFERIGAEKTGVEGTGLGLMVVKKLMDIMGGRAGVESVSGEGSTFWIELPHIAGHESALGQTEHRSLHHVMKTQKSGTILYIEDNASNTDLVEQILLDYRPFIRFVSSTKGAQTVPLAIKHTPDLILLDLDLPDMKGFEVIRLLQGEEKTRAIPVVVVSADAMAHQIEILMNAGSKDYLTKPLDIRTFLKVVDEWMEGTKYRPV